MKFLGLTPEDRPDSNQPSVNPGPGLPFAVIYGGLSFGAVSVLAYSIWAFRLVPGTAALYSSIAAVYIGLAGLALSRLVLVRGAWPRFSLLFAISFFVYAVGWCACWFGLKGKYDADFWGAAVGLAAMTWLFQSAFGKKNDFLPLFAVLFTFHSLGYYLGDALHLVVRGTGGRLLWGASHGLGFGAGLGYILFHCQSRSRVVSS